MAERIWHIFRKFQNSPYLRWACGIVEDVHTDDGYRVVDHDPKIADAEFLAGLSFHLHKTHMSRIGKEVGDKIVDGFGQLSPGEDGYFSTAMDRLEGALVGSGRQLG